MPFPVMQISYCHCHKSLMLHWNLPLSAFGFTMLMPLRAGELYICAIALFDLLSFSFAGQRYDEKHYRRSLKHYYMIFFPWVSFLPVKVSTVCTAMLTITCKAPYCLVLVYFVMQQWDGWLKITNHKSRYEPAIQRADTHSEKNFGLKDLTMSNLFNFPTVFRWEVGPFRWDKCCHLLLSCYIAGLQLMELAPLLMEFGLASSVWSPLMALVPHQCRGWAQVCRSLASGYW